jgi:ankyrin repeat protein
MGSSVVTSNARADGETALLLAVRQADASRVEALLKGGADANGAPDHAPLALAARSRDVQMLRLLLAAGADPNGRLGGETAVHVAALMGNEPALEVLFAAKAQLDDANAIGTTPSIAAAAAENWHVVLWLLQHGATPWAANQAGLTLGGYAGRSRLLADSAEGRARDQVIALLRAAGLPWPAPTPPQVRAARAAGTWPPHR